MSSNTYGYVRVSTREQNEDRQLIALKDYKVLESNIYVAQTERENIHQRQREGIEAAKLRGVKFGRSRKPVPEEFWRIREEWINKRISSREAARELSIAEDTFLRWVHGK